MLPHEIQAAIAGDARLTSGYNNFLSWIASGAKHGSNYGLMPNEAVVRSEQTPWGEGINYDAAGNVVSGYRPARPGEISPYQGTGPSAPEWTPQQLAGMHVPYEFTAKGIAAALAAAGKPDPFINAMGAQGGFAAK
jgi:hypothetical protein